MLHDAMIARAHGAGPQAAPSVLSLFTLGLLLSVAGSVAGCKRSSERQLVDTERRHFTAKCERSGECNTERIIFTSFVGTNGFWM